MTSQKRVANKKPAGSAGQNERVFTVVLVRVYKWVWVTTIGHIPFELEKNLQCVSSYQGKFWNFAALTLNSASKSLTRYDDNCARNFPVPRVLPNNLTYQNSGHIAGGLFKVQNLVGVITLKRYYLIKIIG